MADKEAILIIDDEVQIRRLLEITLSSNGYKILSAAFRAICRLLHVGS